MSLVWIDGWQMQCCGEAFAVGADVSWTLLPWSDDEFAQAVLGDDLAASVTHHEEHHGGAPEGTAPTSGRVREINAVFCVYRPTPGGPENQLYPVTGSLVLEARTAADGWESEGDQHTFVAYLVELEP